MFDKCWTQKRQQGNIIHLKCHKQGYAEKFWKDALLKEKPRKGKHWKGYTGKF